MSVYGYIPANDLPSHSTLTYWAQAASLAGLPCLTTTSFVLGLNKSQLSLAGGDVVHKSRSALSPTSGDELISVFGVHPQMATHSTNAIPGLLHTGAIDLHAHIQHYHHQQQLRKQQQQHHHHHHFFSRSPPLGSGLAPLQALCQSDVSSFLSKTPAAAESSNSPTESRGDLKFGMSRILSEDFGKVKCEKENFQLSSVPESCRSLTLCPCNSASCAAYASPPSPYTKTSLPSLSAVHALQPPSYPLSSSADALPGPYSILSTESALANHPKRKRSWSRAVFSNLQRKGLEKRFEVQKYVTKPDRRQLAAMLGLTDAQVKVWFQNRRMKWRHAQQQGEKEPHTPHPQQQGEKEPHTPHPDQQQEDENNQQANDSCQFQTPAAVVTKLDGTVDIPGSRTCLDLHDPVSGDVLVSTNTFSCGQSQTEQPREVQSRLVRSSPQDLRMGQLQSPCLPDGHVAETSVDSRSGPSAETDRCQRCSASISPGHDAGVSPGNAGGSRLRDQDKPLTSGYNLDLDNGSSASLEIDSDVEVNDTDVDMSDSDGANMDKGVIVAQVSLSDFGVEN